MNWNIVTQEEKAKCQALGSEFWPIELDQKIGISSNDKDGIVPINGLRHLPEPDTTGWYIWAEKEMGTIRDTYRPTYCFIRFLDCKFSILIKYWYHLFCSISNRDFNRFAITWVEKLLFFFML
jgi:hypothetical protein